MTPKQFKRAREKLGFTKRALAIRFDVDPATIRRMESGEGGNPVREVYALALMSLVRTHSLQQE